MEWMRCAKMLSAFGVAVMLPIVGAGCSAADPGGERPAKQIDQAMITSGTPAPSAPDCRRQTNQHVVYAIRHSSSGMGQPGVLTAYASKFPTGTSDPTAAGYEQKVWNIPRANGYVYMVHDPNAKPDRTGLVPFYVYIVGIRDQDASPPYLMSPPPDVASIRFPDPNSLNPFVPTASDYSTEYNLSQSYQYTPPVNAQFQPNTCVTILSMDVDSGGNRQTLDYFALSDEHDPQGPPW